MGVKAEVFGPNSYDSCAHRVKKLTGIILVFHPGCGHCVQMRPEWEAMKRNLSPGSKVVEVDASEMSGNDNINQSALSGTSSYPEIIKMKNGEIVDKFLGQRTAREMKKFAEKGMPKTNKNKKPKTKKNKTRKRKSKRR